MENLLMKSNNILAMKQQGAVLITALVFMGILTMIGISVMRSNTLDVKIHNAMMDRLNSFQCAEAALRQGELFIKNSAVQPSETVSGVPSQAQSQVWGIYASDINDLVSQDSSWWASNGWQDNSLIDASSGQVGCTDASTFIVQSLGGVSDGSGNREFKAKVEDLMSGYRISSRSDGMTGKAVTILQSTYIRQFN